jgi:hypothetical protein
MSTRTHFDYGDGTRDQVYGETFRREWRCPFCSRWLSAGRNWDRHLFWPGPRSCRIVRTNELLGRALRDLTLRGTLHDVIARFPGPSGRYRGAA